jgi:hypothetical protein
MAVALVPGSGRQDRPAEEQLVGAGAGTEAELHPHLTQPSS